MKKDPIEDITAVSKMVELAENLGRNVLYRGQPQDKPLLPKIARGDLKPRFLIEEKQLLDEFRIRSAPFLGAGKRDEWDWLAIAQHHGMATRLLDWSANPMAALWFAVKNGTQDGEDGVLWILPYDQGDLAKQNAESPFEGEATKLFQPKHIAKTIVAQSGWFTVHKYIDDSQKFVPLEDNKLYKHNLENCRIPSSKFEDLKYQLDVVGINDSTMFPDLNGLCSYLNFIHLPDIFVRRFPRLP